MERNRKCVEWLRSILRDGELHPCEEVRDAARAEKYSRADLKAARRELGVKTYHMFDGGKATENWFWYMEG